MMRISGPLLDRIDIHIEVPRLKENELMGQPQGETSRAIRDRVLQARLIQEERFHAIPGMQVNAHMQAKQLRQNCKVNEDVRDLLRTAIQQVNLSARAFDRILKLARTIADLEGSESTSCTTPPKPHSIGRWTGSCLDKAARSGDPPRSGRPRMADLPA